MEQSKRLQINSSLSSEGYATIERYSLAYQLPKSAIGRALIEDIALKVPEAEVAAALQKEQQKLVTPTMKPEDPLRYLTEQNREIIDLLKKLV